MKLYPHQEGVVSEAREALLSHQCVLLQAATGFGKTAVASFMLSRSRDLQRRAMFVCHRRELLAQTSATLKRVGVPHGFIAAGMAHDPFVGCHIASVDTLKNRLDKIPVPNLLIFDECHHSAAAGWEKVHEWALKGGARIVGLTATPIRTDGMGLNKYFYHMVKGPSVAWLMENNYLSRYEAYAPSTPDLSNVKTRLGDYDQAEIAQIMDNSMIFGCAVDNWKKLAMGKRTIAFAPSIKLSEKLAAQFSVNGIPAEHLDGGTDKKDRAETIRRFASGETKVLTNVNLFSEGFDLSAIAGRDVPIEAVILYRPTQSLAMHLQQVGRALRPKPYPAIILDHAGNLMRHGLPDMPFEWTLEGKQKKKRGVEEPDVKVKQCPECYAVHPPAEHCPHCGFIYPKPEGKIVEIVDGDLKRIDAEAMMKARKKAKQMIAACVTREDFVQVAKMCGYKPGWVHYAWKDHLDGKAREQLQQASAAKIQREENRSVSKQQGSFFDIGRPEENKGGA